MNVSTLRFREPGWLLLGALMACSGGESPPEARVERASPSSLPNVVLITLDTTRADRIGAWGYELAKTDQIDALASSGRRYARAY